jgi:hypothetical protein
MDFSTARLRKVQHPHKSIVRKQLRTARAMLARKEYLIRRGSRNPRRGRFNALARFCRKERTLNYRTRIRMFECGLRPRC